MARLIFAITALLLAFAPAHAQTGSAQTKSNLVNEINTDFPSQNIGAITPTVLRQVTLDLLASSQQFTGVNAQTGTSYTIQTSDYGQLVTFNNSSPVAVTLPQGTSGNGFSPFNVLLSNIGTGTVTITPTTSTINGAASLDLAAGESTWIVSDGTNYKTSITALAPSGNTGTAATVSGNLVQGDCLVPDSHKNIVDLGSPCVAATSGVGAGTANQMPFYKTSGSVVSATSTLPLGMDLTGGQATHDQQPNGGDPVWHRLGVAINPNSSHCDPTSSNIAAEHGMLYEGNPQILTGVANVFKIWFHTGTVPSDINYAESADGVNFTCYSGNPVIGPGWSETHSITKDGSGTYHLFPINTSTLAVDHFTSTDGIHWTLAGSSLITFGTQAWENLGSGLSNPSVWLEGTNNWKMLYASGSSLGGCGSFQFAQGLATASNPNGPWTKSASNPVITDGCPGGMFVYKSLSGTYYAWSGTTNQISDITRWSSTNLTTWTKIANYCTFCRATLDEGSGEFGQVADTSLIQVGNYTYQYYAASPDGNVQKIKVAVAYMPIEQVITTNEGSLPNFYGAVNGTPLQIGSGVNGEHINIQFGFSFASIGINAFYNLNGAFTKNVPGEPAKIERWNQTTTNAGVQWQEEFINAAGAEHSFFGADMTSGGSINHVYIFGGANLCFNNPTTFFGTCQASIDPWAGIGFASSQNGVFGTGGILYSFASMPEVATRGGGVGSASIWDDATTHLLSFNQNNGGTLAFAGLSGSFTPGHCAEVLNVGGGPFVLVDYGATCSGSAPTTVSGLPTCNAGSEGSRGYVTDQNTAVSYRGAVTGSGSTRQAVLCSNSAWIQD